MAAGGTELAHAQLLKRLPETIKDRVQIISRPTDIDPEKRPVLWIQDMPGDVEFLADPKERRNYSGIVMVSAWQQFVFNVNMGIPFQEMTVLKNAIEPIPAHDKPLDETINLIYHPTPHRGLGILVPVFIELCKKYDNLHLDVFSNFDIYGWSNLNEQFEELYQQCREHPNITYHGSQPHEVVREALQKAHIFAYPCIWRETSCMSAMEAMSARCLTVAPNYGALPETLANFNIAYNWTEDFQQHASIFSQALSYAIENINDPGVQQHLDMQKAYADKFYDWETRIKEWEIFFDGLRPPTKRKGEINWM
jgi:UDP-glucose:(glucosyl)LPS alpha-1,2-glucosyltransferase